MRRISTLSALLVTLLAFSLAGCSESMLTATRSASPDAAPPGYEGDDPLANDDDAAGDDDDDDAGSEIAEILNIDPPPGSTDHHYRRPLRVTFTEDAAGTPFGLFRDGEPVPHDVSWDDDFTTCTLTPLPRLEPDTTYSVEVDLYGQGQAWTFTTSSVGALDREAETLDGATFVLDTTTAEVLAPAGLTSLGASATIAGSPAVQIDFTDPGTWNRFTLQAGLVTAAADTWTQDECANAELLSVEDGFQRSDALFSAAGDSMSFYLGETLVEVEDAWLEGDFAPDAQTLVEVDLSGWVRADSLDGLAGGQDACSMLAELLGAECVACPQTDAQCAWFEVEGLSGTRTELDIQDIDSDSCPDTPTAWLGCSAAGASGAPALLLIGLLGIAVRRRTN